VALRSARALFGTARGLLTALVGFAPVEFRATDPIDAAASRALILDAVGLNTARTRE
jgi:hypothetical protein